VNQVGEYSVSATNSYGCISRDTIKIVNVFPSPNLVLNKQNVLCLNQNNTINAGSGFASYLWQNGKTDSLIVVTVPGLYKITVSNNYNCFASDSVNILKVANPPSNFLDADSAICDEDSIIIYPHQVFNEYLWSTGSTNNSIQIRNPGIYWLTVKDKNSCIGSDTIHILQKDCAAAFFIPNAFTPNNDGLNDIYKPIITGRISYYYFAIYNRFGQIIFSTNNPDMGWNGTVKDADQNSGTFVWLCRYKMKNKAAQLKKGTVVLIR
jgi:gliding motility-associated-like protein